MKVKSIHNQTLTQKVQESILAAIREGGFKPGDLLPGELELAKRFQVSRGVIREAMGDLRLIGLVHSRRSRGCVLGQPEIFGVLRLAMDPAFLQPQTSRELFELRLVLEIGMVDLLFLNRAKIDLAALEEIVERCENAANENLRVQADIDFHAALYRATGNHTLAAFQQLLRAFFQQVLVLESEGDRRVGRIQHRKLVEILGQGSCEEFRAAMREHLSVHFQRITPH